MRVTSNTAVAVVFVLAYLAIVGVTIGILVSTYSTL